MVGGQPFSDDEEAMSRIQSTVGISLPMLNQSAHTYADLARAADEAGLSSLWDYEFYRNPFSYHAINATVTKDIRLGTSIATAASRTPFEMANAIADIDELSGGRAILGTSVGGVGWTDVFNGTEVDHPVPRMREYVEQVRAVWDHFATGEPYAVDGRFYQGASPQVNPWGVREMVRPRVPVYLAGIKPLMLQLAGEIADGLIGFMYTPEFIEAKVKPNIAKGAAKAGRDASEIDLTSLVITAISEDREMARRIARINVGNYIAYPVAWPVVEHMGLQEERDAVLNAMLFEGTDALEKATSDKLLEVFAISGTPDEAMEQFERLDGVLDHIVLHTPYVPPIDGKDSAESFRTVCRTFAPHL